MAEDADAPFFFYGTLRDRAFLSRLIGRPVSAKAARPARLGDHRRVFVAGQAYPTVIPAEGHRVDGLLVGGFSPGEVRRLMAYEGPEYEIAWLPVVAEDGRDVVARVFVTGPRVPTTRRDWR